MEQATVGDAGMGKNAGKKNRSGSIFLLFLFLLVASIVLGSFLFYRRYEHQFRAQVENQLAAIAELKVNELVNWRKERLANAEILINNPAFSEIVRSFFEKTYDPEVQKILQIWMSKYLAYRDFMRIFLLDTQGVIRMSAPEASPIDVPHLHRDAAAVLASGRMSFIDLHRDTPAGPVHMAILVPLFAQKNGHQPVGVIALRIDPNAYLYPFIKRWPIPSRTAETLLIRRDGNDALFLNELKFRNNTALNLRIPLERKDNPAVNAALGREGIVEGRDYRGLPVIAAVRHVRDSPWFLVARMDRAELFAPLRERLWQMILTVAVLLLGSGAGLGLVWRQRRIRYYLEQADAAKIIRETKDFLENLINYANTPIVVWDPHFRITRFNHAFEVLTGRKAEDVIGQSLEILFPAAMLENWLKFISKTLAGERWDTVEIPIRHLDSSVHVVLWSSATIFSPDGITPVATITQGLDITERKRAEDEIRKHRDHLEELVNERTEKLATTVSNLERSNSELEQFAYVASHDLQEPLRMVSSYTQLLEQRYKDQLDQDAKDFISYAVDGANRMQRLIQDLLVYSRITTRGQPLARLDSHEALGEAIKNLQAAIQESGALVSNGDLPLVFGDHTQIVQVFQNLVGNSIKFQRSNAAPRIHISTENDALDSRFRVFKVSDNGIGIDAKYFSRLFTIFQRLHTRQKYPGTGIGLALCKRIIHRHGGRIWVESEPGKGSIFLFTLPSEGNNI
jgi:PAS domain S-box-containing protein